MTPEESEQHWRKFLEEPDTFMRVGRRFFSRLPHGPRCQLCASPFHGPGGSVMRLIGKRQSQATPNMCTSCENAMKKRRGGATVTGTMLFADIRGSTTLAEGMSPAAYHDLLNRFYTASSEAVFAHGGVVDKFVGDELVAFFFPKMSGTRPVAKAVAAAEAVLRANGHDDAGGPWVPIGAGVHTGAVWFGATGEGDYVEITAVGDAVNVAARLGAAAGAGEVLVSADAATAAELDPSLARRPLQVKGKDAPIDVVSLRVGRA
jgi:adenylate cyclase